MPCWSRPLLLVVLASYQVQPVAAPSGFSFLSGRSAVPEPANQGMRHQDRFSTCNTGFASQVVFSIGAIAAGAHLCALSRSLDHDDDDTNSRPARGNERCDSPCSPSHSNGMPSPAEQLTDGEQDAADEVCLSSDDLEDVEGSSEVSRNAQQTGKLWSKNEFPEGIKGAANWDLLNLAMAQQWQCPCTDRSCLSLERYPKVDPLYDFRKTFQTTSKKMGKRDSFRKKFLEPAYSPALRSFSRSINQNRRSK